MNRIYQGRVATAHFFDKGDTHEQIGLDVLWDHHQLFQDAINYYHMALAAMAPDPESAVGRLRQRMAEAWEPTTRGARKFQGLRSSLIRAGLISDEKMTFEDGLTAVLAGNSEPTATLQLAVDLLVHKISGGEGAIQQGGRNYWPRFCNPHTKPTWDFSRSSVENEVNKARLAELIHSKLSDQMRTELARDLELEWVVKVSPEVKDRKTGEQAVERVVAAIDAYLEAFSTPEPRISSILQNQPQAIDQLGKFKSEAKDLLGISFPGNRKAVLALVNAVLLFKYFPHPLTQEILAAHIKQPNLKPKKAKHGSDQVQFDQLGDDPIKLARGSRGYIFPAFTALPLFGVKNFQTIAWSEFDIAAFKEALKTINQFRLKTEERTQKRDLFLQAIAYMDGQTHSWQDPEGKEDSDPPPRLANDPRCKISMDLINEMRSQLELTNHDKISYVIERRRLRGWKELAEKFNRQVDPGEAFSEEKAKTLEGIIKAYQTEHPETMGDFRLFQSLVNKPDRWLLWQQPTEEQRQERIDHDWPIGNFLHSFRLYHEYDEQAKWLKEPIRFTPADSFESRRLFMLSDLTGRSKVKHRSEQMMVEVSVAVRLQGVWQEKRVLLKYNAPRLLRDQLRNAEEASQLEHAPWLQPMMEALGGDLSMPQRLTDHAVALMPEKDAAGNIRYLLNFPITLDPAPLLERLGKAEKWKRQFNCYNEKNFHLHWPSTMKSDSKKQLTPWWTNGEGFSCLAVDLGVRASAAAIVMDFKPQEEEGNHHQHLIGTAEGVSWRSCLRAQRIIKVAGENQKIWQNGELIDEPFGARGRMADPSEWEEFCEWLDFFQIPVDHFWRLEGKSYSFPEQNDCMIRMLRRGMTDNHELNQCLRFAKEKGDYQKISQSQNPRLASIKNESPQNQLFKLEDAILKLHQELIKRTVALANRVLPLRGRQWEWVKRDHGDNWVLRQTEPDSSASRRKIRGQRGLSLARIEQLQDFRKRVQSLNKALQRQPGSKVVTGTDAKGQELPDPCPDVARKLEHLKEQRTNQIAHFILAEALGLELKAPTKDPSERKTRDIHGEYELQKDRNPVDFIVFEDLSSYRTSQDKGPKENSMLMKWCHRAVTEKLIQLCEPYGIPVLQTPAAYTSQFCSKTGAAGFRAREVRPGEEQKLPRKLQADPRYPKFLTQLEQLKAAGRSDLPLLIPIQGGEVFVAANDFEYDCPKEISMHADLNAACNLALRAVAAPDMHHLLPRLRAAAEKGQLWFSGQSIRDKNRFTGKVRFALQEPTANDLIEEDEEGESSSKIINIFVDLSRVAKFERIAHIEGCPPLSTAKGLWGTIKQAKLDYCLRLNRERLKKWQQEGKLDDLDV
ncbi:MAG: type V CRISPR-associated protein Cas12b [Verrucomicrobiales bacterium]